jgi:hypothetical protein
METQLKRKIKVSRGVQGKKRQSFLSMVRNHSTRGNTLDMIKKIVFIIVTKAIDCVICVEALPLRHAKSPILRSTEVVSAPDLAIKIK